MTILYSENTLKPPSHIKLFWYLRAKRPPHTEKLLPPLTPFFFFRCPPPTPFFQFFDYLLKNSFFFIFTHVLCFFRTLTTFFTTFFTFFKNPKFSKTVEFQNLAKFLKSSIFSVLLCCFTQYMCIKHSFSTYIILFRDEKPKIRTKTPVKMGWGGGSIKNMESPRLEPATLNNRTDTLTKAL